MQINNNLHTFNENFSVKKLIKLIFENFGRVISIFNDVLTYVDDINQNSLVSKDKYLINLGSLTNTYSTIITDKLQAKIENTIVSLVFTNYKDLDNCIIQFFDENQHKNVNFEFELKKTATTNDFYDIIEFKADFDVTNYISKIIIY